MRDDRKSDEFDGQFKGAIRIHFRLADIFLEQVVQSAPILATVVKDVHASCIHGAHTALKVGETFGGKSKMSMNFIHGVSDILDKFVPMLTEAQLGVFEAMIESTRQGFQLLKKGLWNANGSGTPRGIQSRGSDRI